MEERNATNEEQHNAEVASYVVLSCIFINALGDVDVHRFSL